MWKSSMIRNVKIDRLMATFIWNFIEKLFFLEFCV